MKKDEADEAGDLSFICTTLTGPSKIVSTPQLKQFGLEVLQKKKKKNVLDKIAKYPRNSL